MAKVQTVYRCEECGSAHPKWAGRCGACGEWNTLSEDVEVTGAALPVGFHAAPAVARPIADIDVLAGLPRPTGVGELDRVLSGGFVPGSVTLLGGEPGIGKSTLLLQALAAQGSDAGAGMVLYVAAEESAQQVRLRAERLGALAPSLFLLAETSLPRITAAMAAVGPSLVVIDSIQAVLDPQLGSGAGSVTQVRGCAQQVVAFAKASGCPVVLVGHVTKDGALAGPRVLEHVVDTVLAFEGDRHHALRTLRAVKHRFGTTSEVGLFEMTGAGLEGVPDAGRLFLADRTSGVAGSVVVPVMEGRRTFLVEVQALVVPSSLPAPRRTAQGMDHGRLGMLLAVLERRVGLALGGCDVYTSAVGGLRLTEPGSDLGVCVAVASALTGCPVADDVVVCGEVGLAGELRQVPQVLRRLGEADRHGFTRAVAPASTRSEGTGLEVHWVTTLADALAAAGMEQMARN